MDAGARVLLADSDLDVLAYCGRALLESGYDVIGLCTNGLDALRIIVDYEPDAVLMNLELKDCSALYILEQLNVLPMTSMPAVAVIIPEEKTEGIATVEKLGAFAVIHGSPLPVDVVEAVRLAGPMERMIPYFAKEEVIRKMLDEMSIQSHLKGYEYLATCIGICCRSQQLYRSMSRLVFPEAAARFGTTVKNLERCIRTAIENAWEKGDLNKQYAYFGNTIDEEKGKPTTCEFIARITEALRLEAM